MRQIKIVVRQDKKLKTAFRIPGIKGEGVPPGGTTGQVLQKHSDTDYDTEWIDNGGGGGGGAKRVDSTPTVRSGAGGNGAAGFVRIIVL